MYLGLAALDLSSAQFTEISLIADPSGVQTTDRMSKIGEKGLNLSTQLGIVIGMCDKETLEAGEGLLHLSRLYEKRARLCRADERCAPHDHCGCQRSQNNT